MKDEKAPDDGYFFTHGAMRDTVAAWKSEYDRAEMYKSISEELKEVAVKEAEITKDKINDLEYQIERERKVRRKVTRNNTTTSILIGLVVGGAIGAVIANN